MSHCGEKSWLEVDQHLASVVTDDDIAKYYGNKSREDLNNEELCNVIRLSLTELVMKCTDGIMKVIREIGYVASLDTFMALGRFTNPKRKEMEPVTVMTSLR